MMFIEIKTCFAQHSLFLKKTFVPGGSNPNNVAPANGARMGVTLVSATVPKEGNSNPTPNIFCTWAGGLAAPNCSRQRGILCVAWNVCKKKWEMLRGHSAKAYA